MNCQQRLYKNYLTWSLSFLCLTSVFLCSTSYSGSYAQYPASYAVASAHPLATNAGLSILAQGGNAFDAAVAVSAVLAVVGPYHSGLGGGGFWLLHQASTNKNFFIDGREVAPLAATKNMFLDSKGKLKTGLSLNGGLSAAIPGEPAALVMIAQRFGRLPLSQTLAPAIKIAEEGFLVDHQLHFFLKIEERLQQLQKYPATAAIFLQKDKPYPIGGRLVQRDLAATLRALAKSGHDGFYRGEIAHRLVDAVNRSGGIWTLQDLASYQVKVREPLQGKFHHMHVITSPPPSAGGVALVMMLNILEKFPLSSISKAQWVHYLTEAMRLAFWQRRELLGDPDFVKIPLQKLLSVKTTASLRGLIYPDRARSSYSLTHKVTEKEPSSNTTHFSILDRDGNRVAATLTLNYIFGSSVIADGTGVLLNDEMDDFSTALTEKNAYGLAGSLKNSIEPGKRPLSSMTPTFLEIPGRVAILGTPGGSRIPTMVLLASLLFNDSYGAISMVSSMRFHHQYLPDVIQFEPDTFSRELQEKLKRMGYQLAPLQGYYGDMQAITWDREHNQVTAASDPRDIGLSATIGTHKWGFDLTY